MKLTKNKLKRLIKEVMEAEFGGGEAEFTGFEEKGSSNIEWYENSMDGGKKYREAQRTSVAGRADVSAEDRELVAAATGGQYKIHDNTSVEDLMNFGESSDPNYLLVLGRAGTDLWFKTADGKYGKLSTAEQTPGNELGVLDTKPNFGGHI